MARAKKICARSGCPEATAGTYCTTHAREADQARGTRTQRGYGTEHQKQRARTKRMVDAGLASCARCHQPIAPGSDWHLDHDDEDRSRYIGPAHARCNLSAAGKRSHRYD